MVFVLCVVSFALKFTVNKFSCHTNGYCEWVTQHIQHTSIATCKILIISWWVQIVSLISHRQNSVFVCVHFRAKLPIRNSVIVEIDNCPVWSWKCPILIGYNTLSPHYNHIHLEWHECHIILGGGALNEKLTHNFRIYNPAISTQIIG